MHDQADQLRRLVSAADAPHGSHGRASPIVVVAGAKPAVGATTIAVNLALALGQTGRRTLLVDADLDRPALRGLCEPMDPAAPGLADVLAGRRELDQSIHDAAGGIRVVPGISDGAALLNCSPRRLERFLGSLRDSFEHAETVIVDVGPGTSPLARRLWHEADLVCLVTTTDGLSVMEGYAAIKTMVRRPGPARVAILVNMVDQSAQAAQAYERLECACERFLQVPTELAGMVPYDPAVELAARALQPLLAHDADSAAARAVIEIVRRGGMPRRLADTGERRYEGPFSQVAVTGAAARSAKQENLNSTGTHSR